MTRLDALTLNSIEAEEFKEIAIGFLDNWQKDKSYDFFRCAFELTDIPQKEMMDILDIVFDCLGGPSISMVQANMAIYSEGRPEKMQDFYKWISDILDDYRMEAMTQDDVKWKFGKAIDGIEKKMNDPRTPTVDKLGIANTLIMLKDIFY